VLRRSIGYDRGESGEIQTTAGCKRGQTPAGLGSGYCWNSVNRGFILPILAIPPSGLQVEGICEYFVVRQAIDLLRCQRSVVNRDFI
jgi:hypothetical protein